MPIDPFSQANPGFPPLGRAGWLGRKALSASPANEPTTRLATWHMSRDVARIGPTTDPIMGGNVPGYGPPPPGDPFDFRALDGNGDGVLSGLEVAGVDPAMRQAIDTDRNGELSNAEFTLGTLRARALQRDQNGDGYLSGTEISADLDRFAYTSADGRRIISAATLDAALAKGAVPQPVPTVVPGPSPAPIPPPSPAPAPAYGPAPIPFAPAPAPPIPQPMPAPQPYPTPQPYQPPQPAPTPQPYQPPQPAPAPPRKDGCCPH